MPDNIDYNSDDDDEQEQTPTLPLQLAESTHTETPTPEPAVWQSKHTKRPSERKQEADAGCKITTTQFYIASEPQSIEEALASPNAEKWYNASIEELNSLYKNDTWILIKRPTDHNIIKTKFLCKAKDADTPNPRYKVRLVAQGYTQISEVDFTNTFAPIVKATSVRTIFAISA